MMKKGIIVATHPEDHSVDLVLSDGRRLTGVQVLTPNGSARTGTFDMPAVPPKSGDKWDISQKNGQDQIALVDFVGDVPVVVGYLFPQTSQMTFKDPKLKFTRHQSDVSTAIDGDGNIQISHPSGMFIRIGEAPESVDLTQKNEDKSLGKDRNTSRKVNVRIQLAGNTLQLTMTPNGEFDLLCDGNVNVKSKASMRFEAAGDIKFHAPGGMTFDTPNGHFSNVATANTDFIAANTTLVGHKHPGILAGPSLTQTPTKDASSGGPEWDGISVSS